MEVMGKLGRDEEQPPPPHVSWSSSLWRGRAGLHLLVGLRLARLTPSKPGGPKPSVQKLLSSLDFCPTGQKCFHWGKWDPRGRRCPPGRTEISPVAPVVTGAEWWRHRHAFFTHPVSQRCFYERSRHLCDEPAQPPLSVPLLSPLRYLCQLHFCMFLREDLLFYSNTRSE